MNARRVVTPLLVVSALAAAAPVGAQSLADIARKEAERRGSTPAPGKTYTNENLKPDFTTPAPAPAPAAPAASEPAAAAAAPAEEPKGPDEFGVTPRDQQEPQPTYDKGEDFWRGRANTIRARLNKQNAQILELRKQVAGFAGRPSPERDIAERALSKAQDDLVALNDEWLRFERQARERNVPDAWIR